MRTRHVCDFRSDTITTPTQAMRDAMHVAKVGDDMYFDDPTVNELQRTVAELFGKDDALYFPSGTMANICSVMTHCPTRGDEIIAGDMSHIFLNEQGGVCTLGGLSIWPAPTQDDGTILIEDLERCLRPVENICTPATSLVSIENTHNFKGGIALTEGYMREIGGFCKQNRLPLHLDGARILHAATYLECDVKDLTRDADSVMMCISKGLGAPIGSLLAGSSDFCKRARRVRKLLGGGMRQAGIMAAAGIVSLNTVANELYKDHDKARNFAQSLSAFDNDVFDINLKKCQTNMVVMKMKNGYSPALFADQMNHIYEDEMDALGEEVQVRLMAITKTLTRATFHIDNTMDDVTSAVKKIKFVVEHHCNKALDVKAMIDNDGSNGQGYI